MNIDNRALPPFVVGALRAALAAANEKTLRDLAAQHADLARGFRPGKADASVIRTRALAAFDRMHELPDAYRSILRDSTLSRSLIAVLSEASLEQILDQIVTLHGLGAVTAAMLLDDRESIRTRAFCLLDDGEERPRKQEAAAPAGAAAAFIERMTPFLEVLSGILSATGEKSETATVAAARATHQPEPDPARERQLAEELRDKRVEATRLQRDLDRVNASRERTLRELEALARAQDAAKQRCASLELELHTLRERFGDRVEAEVARRLDARLLPWLLPAENLEIAANEIAEDDLCDAAEKLLQHQMEIDRRYGLRSRIQAEIARLEALCERLKSAQTDSLRPLSVLSSMLTRIDERVALLRSRLGAPSMGADDGIAGSIERMIASAETFARLAQMRETLNSLASLDLMTEHAQRRLHGRIRDTASKLYATASMRSHWRPDPSASAESSELAGVPLYAIQNALARGTACTLMIDGHNVLFGLTDLFHERHAPGASGIRARMRLEQMLVELSHRCPSLTIHLWFDGASLTDRTASENVRVHFSGGQGRDRADDRIAAHVLHLREASPEHPRAVVTADRALAGRVREAGSLVMTPIELGIWLESVS